MHKSYYSEKMIQFTVSNGVLCGIPMEPFCEMALDIQKRSKKVFVFFGGYTNGCDGYLPTYNECFRRVRSLMKLDIRNHEYSIIWDGVYYHALSDYPKISDWELKGIILFMEYEKQHGRNTEIVSDNQEILKKINYALNNRNYYRQASRPNIITECTSCKQKGCITRFVCHTASIENAISIFKCGSLMSAVKARNLSSEELSLESRNAAKDPIDYFDYLMLSWGNCPAGDRLIMERKLKRDPNEEDLSTAFTPGIRFYFEYDKIVKHPNVVFDGYHPIKIRDKLVLDKNIYAIIIPLEYKSKIELFVPLGVSEKVFYIENDCKDIWEWSDKVYCFVSKLRPF